jgi:hypothetical protein
MTRKKIRTVRNILTIILLTYNITVYSQNKQVQDFVYADSYGDTIVINDTDILIDQIDTEFLKNNFTGEYVIESLLSSDIRYKINITGLKRIKRNKKYQISVMITKQNPSVEDLLKSMGFSNYIMTLKKIDNIYKIETITYLSSEI